MKEKIFQICEQTREYILIKYGDVQGTCVEASEMIQAALKEQLGISARLVEGWCLYDDDSSCTDRCYDEHTWVEIELNGETIYIDVTADQFNSCMFEDLGRIIVGVKPECMLYEKPPFEWLEEA